MTAGTTVARINTIVTANTTQFTAAMGKAQTRAGKFALAAGTAARAASGPLTLALVAAGAAAISSASQFESSMGKIESLVGLSAEAVDGMTDSVKALAGETGRGPAELADAMFFITSAGLRGSAAMETLEASAKAAAVGLGDTSTIADLATSALNAYGAENLSATDATDVLTAAVREGKLEASELSGAMGQTLPVASAMGVSFDEVGAAFAAMSRTGTGASEAATQLRGILSTLLRPSKQAEDALNDMGMSSAGLQKQIKDEGLLATLQTLVGSFEGNAAATSAVFGNVRALTGVLDLMGKGADTTAQIFESMSDTTGTLQQAFEVTSDTSAFKFRQALAEVQESLVNLGEAIMPTVLMMVEGFQSMVRFIKDLPDPIKLAAAAFALLVAASGPIGAITIAVGGLLYAFGKLGEEGRRAKDRQAELTDEFKAAGAPTSTMIDRMSALAASIEDVADASDNAANPVGDLVGSQLALGMALDNEVLPLVEDLGLSMDDIAAAAANGSDEFQRLETAVGFTGSTSESLRKNFDQLTEAEKKVAEAIIVAAEAGEVETKQLQSLLDVVDETADAFDDNRKMLEEQSEEFIKSADAVKLLNSANLDGTKVLQNWSRAGMSYTDMARRIDIITRGMSESASDYSVEAHRAGIQTGDLADEMADAETPAEDLTVGMGNVEAAMFGASEEAKTLREAFEDLMGSIVFEGEALNNTQLLIEEFDAVLAEVAEGSVKDLKGSFFDMATEAAGQLGELHDAGLALGSPEMIGAADAFLADIEAMGLAAGIPNDEIAQIQRTLLEMSGQVIPMTLRFKTENLPTAFHPMYSNGTLNVGATGGVVTQPTMALIGEAGPEAVVPLSSAAGASPLPSGGIGGGGETHITINMPTGSNGDDVVRALQNYTRRRGSIPVPVGSARY